MGIYVCPTNMFGSFEGLRGSNNLRTEPMESMSIKTFLFLLVGKVFSKLSYCVFFHLKKMDKIHYHLIGSKIPENIAVIY